MTKKKVYKVSFKGIILPGFDKEQVIENVHDITRIPKHTIARKFFSGKTVIIRHADSQEYASRLQKTFAQAGIETYINEFTESISDEELAETHANTELLETENIAPIDVNEPKKSQVSKIIAAVLVFFVLSVITLFFITDENEQIEGVLPQAKGSLHKAKASLSKAEGSLPKAEGSQESHKDKAVEISDNLESTGEIALADFFIPEQISGLIKITDKSELIKLFQFSVLFRIDTHILTQLKKEINSSLFSISKQSPLYILKTRDNFSLLVNTKEKLSDTFITQLRKNLNIKNSESSCIRKDVKTAIINVINTENYLLVTSIDNTKRLNQFKKLVQQKQLSSNLLNLGSLLHVTNENDNSHFWFYYANTNSLMYITLSSTNDIFWLAFDKSTYDKTTELLKQLNIEINKSNKRSVIQNNDLFGLILIFIAHQSDNFLNKNSLKPYLIKDDQFSPEQVVKIVKYFSDKDIKTYNDKLDIEFTTQWTSGPFAITTNQFKFDKNLQIELLAKGQNIKNLMEYSHSAFLHINTVLNKKNDNILTHDCINNAHSKSYFKDSDGEQEAYINDDFISYQTISAKSEVNIIPGFNNNDINIIEGEIVLQLPDKIQQKIIEPLQEQSKHILYKQILDFSLLLKQHTETNTLTYKLTGKTDQFINIRAYNYSGDVIETVSLEQNKFANNSLIIYKQTFAEPIEGIKVFYTKTNKTINYSFAFKPEISPALNPFAEQEEIPPSSFENNLISFNPGKLDFHSLKKQVLNDNPDWLGEKWSDKKITQKSNTPFYISLFIQEGSTDNLDSVLNIKSSLSPFITQNFTAVKLTLFNDRNTILDQFISFNQNEFIGDTPDMGIKTSGQVIAPKIILYLNSNSAFELDKNLLSKKGNKDKLLHGHITLSLPTNFKTHSKKYTALGQVVKLDGLLIQTVQLDKHQIQFEIRGKIENLVQLKLYNNKNKLISESLEFKHIEKNKALMTLLYNDKIETVTLVLSQNSIIKKYPFSISK